MGTYNLPLSAIELPFCAIFLFYAASLIIFVQQLNIMEDQLKKLIMGLLAYAAQRDISPETLCRLANITLDNLGNNGQALSNKQVSDIWTNAIHLSKDKLFGLHFGESLQLSALGIVGEIIKTSDIVGTALTIAASL